jgi:hypothetical protein
VETEPSPRLRPLGAKLQPLRRFRWLGTLLRLGQRTSGGEAVSENGNGDAHANGRTNGDLEALVHDAVQAGMERVEKRDPLSERNQDGETWLLLGAQRAYDPAVWSPDPRAHYPIGSPERQAWEADRNPITALDDEVQEVYDFLGELDEPSGFNDPN